MFTSYLYAEAVVQIESILSLGTVTVKRKVRGSQPQTYQSEYVIDSTAVFSGPNIENNYDARSS